MKPSPMLIPRLRRAGRRDHAPSQLPSPNLRPGWDRDFNATAPAPCLAPGPRTEPLLCRGCCWVRSGASPSHSIHPADKQPASWELLPAPGNAHSGQGQLGGPGCPPGSILREGIPAPLTQTPSLSPEKTSPAPPGLLEGCLLPVAQPGTPARAREKCGAGTELLFQPWRLAGAGGCFPSTHVRSKQRKKAKKKTLSEF